MADWGTIRDHTRRAAAARDELKPFEVVCVGGCEMLQGLFLPDYLSTGSAALQISRKHAHDATEGVMPCEAGPSGVPPKPPLMSASVPGRLTYLSSDLGTQHVMHRVMLGVIKLHDTKRY